MKRWVSVVYLVIPAVRRTARPITINIQKNRKIQNYTESNKTMNIVPFIDMTANSSKSDTHTKRQRT